MYATLQDLIDRFGDDELIRLTDRANTGAIDPAVVEQALADAAAQIDGHLAGRYQLPLAAVPKILVLTACDLARYFLYSDAAPEQVTKRRDNAIAFLRSVGRGEIGLGVSSLGQPAASSDGAHVESDGRVFGRRDNGFL